MATTETSIIDRYKVADKLKQQSIVSTYFLTGFVLFLFGIVLIAGIWFAGYTLIIGALSSFGVLTDTTTGLTIIFLISSYLWLMTPTITALYPLMMGVKLKSPSEFITFIGDYSPETIFKFRRQCELMLELQKYEIGALVIPEEKTFDDIMRELYYTTVTEGEKHNDPTILINTGPVIGTHAGMDLHEYVIIGNSVVNFKLHLAFSSHKGDTYTDFLNHSKLYTLGYIKNNQSGEGGAYYTPQIDQN